MAGKREATSPIFSDRASKIRHSEEEDWQELNSNRKASPYKRWNQRGLGVITELENVPEDWDWTGYDIDEDDVEANIQRCKDRIEDGIMPQWWEDKLKHLEKYLEKLKKTVAGEPEGLSFDVVSRLKNLELIKEHLEECGDDDNQLVNVHAIMKHYRGGSLPWKHGHVSYWSNGTPISELEEFDWDRFRKLSDTHLEKCKSEADPKPKTGIWVEGGVNLGPDLRQVNWIRPRLYMSPSNEYGRHHQYTLGFRVPGVERSAEWNFMDDTGCSRTVIFTDDFQTSANISNPQRPRFLNYVVTSNAVGQTVDIVIELECCLCSGTDILTPWVPTEIVIRNARRAVGQPRFAGCFLREMVYTATVPDGQSRLFVSKNKSALTANPHFPALHINNSTCPVEMTPAPGVAPPRGWRTLLRSTNLLSLPSQIGAL